MPKSRHTSVIVSPSNSRATNRRRSSITELAFHGINTSRPQKAKSVTHVSGTKCHPCLEPLTPCLHHHTATKSRLASGARFTRERSKVRSLVRPPLGQYYQRLSAGAQQGHRH